MLFIPNNELVKANAGPWYEVGPDRGSKLSYLKHGAIAIEAAGVNSLISLVRDHMAITDGLPDKDSVTNSNDWAGGYSYADFMEVAIHNPSRLRQFDEKSEALTGGDAAGISVLHDVTGDTLDIGRFMDGEPECMASLTNGTPRAKRVQFVLSGDAAARVSASDLLARQMGTLRLIDWLEAQNIRCALTVIFSSQTGHVEIKAKQYHEPLDLNDVAVVAHPGFFRRLIFRTIEYSKTWQYGYGMAGKLTNQVTYEPELLASADTSELVVYIGDSFSDVKAQFKSLEAAITEQLAADTMKPLTVLT